MTLYEYLDTINADYTSATLVPLVWSAADITREELALSAGNPYARVTELTTDVRQRYQTVLVLSTLIQVSLFQDALPDMRAVPQAKMRAVWDQVFDAPLHVTECPYGDADFLTLQYVSGFPPAHETNSGGLSASIRFRLWFARRAKA
jgi:hypothetical protein